MFFLLVIFGASCVRDNIHVIPQRDVEKEMDITFVVPDSIWDHVFNKTIKNIDLENYYAWYDKKPVKLPYEDSLIEYERFKCFVVEKIKILKPDKISGANVIVSEIGPITSRFAHELIFIFLMSTITFLILQRKEKYFQHFENKTWVLIFFVFLFFYALYFSTIPRGIRAIFLFSACPGISLLVSFPLFKKSIKFGIIIYFFVNLILSIIMILFLPKIIPLLVANVAGLFLGMLIICVHKITRKKNNVGVVYKQRFCNSFQK